MASWRRSSSKSSLMWRRKWRAISLGSRIFFTQTVNYSTSPFSYSPSIMVEESNPGT